MVVVWIIRRTKSTTSWKMKLFIYSLCRTSHLSSSGLGIWRSRWLLSINHHGWNRMWSFGPTSHLHMGSEPANSVLLYWEDSPNKAIKMLLSNSRHDNLLCTWILGQGGFSRHPFWWFVLLVFYQLWTKIQSIKKNKILSFWKTGHNAGRIQYDARIGDSSSLLPDCIRRRVKVFSLLLI